MKEDKFSHLMARFSGKHTIFTQPCPDLVTIVESDKLNDQTLVDATLHRYLDPYDLQTLDALVLGCTHFVFFRQSIARICPPGLALIDGNPGTARHLKDLLAQDDALNQDPGPGRVQIANSDPSPAMLDLSKRLLASCPP